MLTELLQSKAAHGIIIGGISVNVLSILSYINPILGFMGGLFAVIFGYYKMREQINKKRMSDIALAKSKRKY